MDCQHSKAASMRASIATFLLSTVLAIAPAMSKTTLVSLHAKPVNPVLSTGEALRFELQLKNVSPRVMRVRRFQTLDNDYNLRVDVFQHKNKIPATYMFINRIPDLTLKKSDYFSFLHPGRVVKFESGTGITEYEQLAPGHYTAIVYLWNDPFRKQHRFFVKSNEVQFEVLK